MTRAQLDFFQAATLVEKSGLGDIVLRGCDQATRRALASTAKDEELPPTFHDLGMLGKAVAALSDPVLEHLGNKKLKAALEASVAVVERQLKEETFVRDAEALAKLLNVGLDDAQLREVASALKADALRQLTSVRTLLKNLHNVSVSAFTQAQAESIAESYVFLKALAEAAS